MSGASSTWFVTGSSGFICQALLHAWAALPAPERPALWLAGRRAPASLPPGARAWPLDLTASTLELPPDVHTVLHLAGEKRDATRMAAVNARAPAQLAEAAARAGAKAFVQLSSVGVYGAGHRAGRVDETHAQRPMGPYETSKHAGEAAVRAICAERGLHCTVLQPSNVIGLVPGFGRPLLGLVRTVARGWFRFIGQHPAWLNYVAVEDVAAALLAAAATPREGRWIINTPAPLPQFVAWVADAAGRPAPTGHVPAWLGAAAAAAGAAGSALLRRELPFSPARWRELTGDTVFDGRAWCQAAGFAYPLGIEAAVRQLVRAYRSEGLL